MDPWEDINPYASSSGSRYGNPVSNFGPLNKTNANQTSRCIWGPAEKSSPRTHNHSLNNAFQEGELSCSRSAQAQWEKIEERASLPTKSCMECQRSRIDMNYEVENELQTRDYHSGRNHNKVAESKLKSDSNCDGLDYIGEIKSDYDNLPGIRLQERDHHNLKKYDYYSDKSDDDIDRLGTDYSSSEENYLVDIELAKKNDQLTKKHDCGHETQLRRRDADNKKQLEKREELVGMRKALVSLVPGGAALSTLSIPQVSEIVKPLYQSPQKGKNTRRRRGRKREAPFRLRLPSGGTLRLKKSDAIALGLIGQKREDVTQNDKNDIDIDRLGKDCSSSEENYLVDIELAKRNDQLKKKHDCGRETQLRRSDDSPYKSHDLVVVKAQLEDRPDFEETCNYIAETGLRKRGFSPECEHVVDPHLKKQNIESDKTHKHLKQRDYHFDYSLLLDERNDYSDSHLRNRDRHLEETDYSSHGYPNKTQLEMKDNADNKKQPERIEGSVNMRKALASLVPGGAALSTLSIPQASEIQKPVGQPPLKGKKRRGRPFRMKLPSGERLQMKKSEAIALGLIAEKREDVTRATGDKQSENLHDKSNGNKNYQLEKREVSHTTDDNVTKSHFDKKDNQAKSYHHKNNINTWSFVEEVEKIKEVSDDSTTKSRWDKKDNHQDTNYQITNNRNKKDQVEKEEEISHTADDYVTKSRWDQKDNHQDKNYHDKNNRNKKDELEKREVSHRTDDYVTKSRWDKRDNHQDKNCHDKGKDTAQKGLKIDIFAIKREVEENIRKARMIKNSCAQISDYSNVQSNPTATTLLESRKCDSNGTQNAVTKTVSENQHNSDRQAVPLGQLHLNTAPKEDKAPHKNSPLDTFNSMVLEKHLAVKLMTKDGVEFLQALGEKTTLKITVEQQMIKDNIQYACIFAGLAGQRTLEAQEAVERFLHPTRMRNVLKTVLFKSDCSVTSLRENLRIIDSSDKYWMHLADLRYHIVLRKEEFLKTSTNVNKEIDLVKEVQRNYSILNAMILGKLDVADGPKHMQILRQWLQQSNVNSTMTNTIGFSFNYVFNYDSALEIDYPKVIKRFSNDEKLEEKLEIRTMLRIGIDVCNDRGWTERLKHHKNLYEAVIISNYSADSIEQFKKNYSQLKEKTAKVTFKPNTIYETSSKEESLKPDPQLQIVNSYAAEQQPPQGHNFPHVGQYNMTPYCTNNSGDFSADINCSNFMIPNNQTNLGAVQTYSDKNVPRKINQLAKAGGGSKQEDDPHATETQHLHCATGGAVEVQPGLRPYLSGNSKWGGERNNMHMNKWRNQRVALMNTPLQHQSPPANLIPFPHAQGVEPMQPPHGVNLASVALPCNIRIPPPTMIPLMKNLDSSILVPATAYKLFEPAGVDFLRTLCEQTNLKIDFIKEQDVSTVQYLCTLQGPDMEKPKAKAAIIKFCNGRDDVGSE